ncbi:MAG: hypothetical protein CVT92_16485, partial [Bacteroidetes bacterium HGW-Bacteroidetes-1]
MTRLLLRFVLPVIIITSYTILLQAQQNYSVVKGERPPVDLNNVTENAYEQDRILIKFKPDKTIEKALESHSKSLNGLLGIPMVDTLNLQYKVKVANRFFQQFVLGKKYTERHKAWGFHLWYELITDSDDLDIKEMVTRYQTLDIIEVAEPVYKKRLIAPVSFEPISNTSDNKSGDKGTNWTPNDPRYAEQWHYHNTGQQGGTIDKDIDLPEAWEIEKGNASVIVAIIDGGIQYNHPDLAGNMWSGIGYNFVTNSSTIQPEAHGTHVAGTVAAVNNNSTGVSGVAGGSGNNDGVRLMSCQVFTSTSGGGFHLAPVYAADNGASISQNSWGYIDVGVYNQSELDAIDYFNTNGGGTALTGGITIFAAGNDGSSGQWYPGCYSGAFSVAATNNNDQKAYYSNYDTWIDISAPGGETISVTSRGVLSTLINNGYGFYQGTSMACPHASGVAALVVSLAYGQLTAADVSAIIKASTDDHYAQNPGYVGKLGTGRLNAHQALLETQSYLSGVLNPQSFIATAVSTTQIDLNWTKNIDSDDVMIIWSSSPSFGIPTEGVAYSTGQTISGGGTVLYVGGGITFNHSGLFSNTQYFYKAFSVNATLNYSNGREASAYTLCDVISTFPFDEDFNGSTSLPNCWEIADHQGGGQVWQIGIMTGQTPVPALTGNYAFLNSDGYGSGNSQNTDLITPLLDLSSYSSVNLGFKHYYKEWSGSSATLSYSINNGTSWIQIQQWTSTTSLNPTIFSQNIAAVAGQSQVKFKWNFTGTWGWFWAVDDIQITGTTTNEVTSFSANPINTNQIDLSWQGSDVLLIWSPTGTFGAPTNGVAYAAGQTISGGGTVLYSGTNTSFSHTGLIPSTTYYYKAFLVQSGINYSNGVTANTTTYSLPIIYNLSGGGTYCESTIPSGIEVTLSSSESGVSYQLLRNGNPYGTPLSGNGTLLTWYDVTEGTYTASASNSFSTIAMNGTVEVTETPSSLVTVTIQNDQNNVCYGTTVTYTAFPENGGVSPSYQWMVNETPLGTDSYQFYYTPENNDQIQVVMTSSLSCVSGNPASSNLVNMVVEDALPASVTIVVDQNPVCDGASVMFTAFPTNGGESPSYQWKLNGNNFGSDYPN